MTWVLALLPGKVDHLACQVGQGILYNVSGVGGAGDGDVMLKRPITWAETTRKGGIQWAEGGGADGQGQREPKIGNSQRRESQEKRIQQISGGGEANGGQENRKKKEVKIKSK